MKNDLRVAFGLLMIILGCVVVFWFMPQVSSHLSADESASLQWFIIVTTLWIIVSLTVKLMMVVGKKANWMNILSIISLLVMIIFVFCFPSYPQAIVHHSLSSAFFIWLFLSSWALIDIFDLKPLKPTA